MTISTPQPRWPGLSPLRVSRFRYLLLGPDGFFKDSEGRIVATSTPREATSFVDVDIASQRGQALIQLGFPVQRIVYLDCA
jgi:hypothetical protein